MACAWAVAPAHGLTFRTQSQDPVRTQAHADLPDLAGPTGEYLDRIERFGFSGVALVARGGVPLHVSAHGVADRERERPVTTGTVFSLGSITKVYTATAILRLVERGELSLDDTLGSFFEGVPADRSAVTLEQLLTHTSGLGESALRDVDDVSRSRIVREALDLPLAAPPGERFLYSNLGYSLLGAVLERVAGAPYETVLRREVLHPADAWETGYVGAAWGDDRLAVGYRGGRRWGTIVERFPGPSGPGWVLMANGGLHATVFDTFRWLRAVVEDRLLSPRWTREFTRIREGATGGEQALGWRLRRAADGGRILSHAGSNGIFTAVVVHLVEHDLDFVVMSNVAEFDASSVAATLERIALGREYALPPRVEPVPYTDAHRGALAGQWSTRGGRLRAVDVGDALELRVEGQDLIDRVLRGTGADLSDLGRSTERARGMLDRVMRGDPEVPERLLELRAGLENRFGPVREVEVLGTAPVWYATPTATWLRFHFEGSDRSVIRRIHWTGEGEIYGIGGSVYAAPLELSCVATGERECTAAHLNLPTERVRLRSAGGERGRVEVGSETLEVRKTTAGRGADAP